MKDPRWICELCKKPIVQGGIVEIFNANKELGAIGNYPQKASPDEDPATRNDAYRVATDPDVATHEELNDATTKAIQWHFNRPINIGFRAVCKDCPSYEFSYGFPPPLTLEGWVGWVFFLEMDKNWMSHWDTMAMLRYWWANRGLPTPGAHGGSL